MSYSVISTPIKERTKGDAEANLRLLLRGNDRTRVWEQARGMWKRRKPDPILTLRKMRREWERTSAEA
ncbi:MAG: hypothetical protein WC659_01680 [Patescibacteria group bacterium]